MNTDKIEICNVSADWAEYDAKRARIEIARNNFFAAIVAQHNAAQWAAQAIRLRLDLLAA